MKRRILLKWLLLIPFLFSTSATAQEPFNPTSKESLRLGVPDPAIIEARDGSGYYIFATGHGVVVWHSIDLKTWKRIGTVFDRHVPAWAEEAVPGCDGIWAPDIQFAGGQYYLYYSVSTFGSQRSVIGLAVNKAINPDAPGYRWEDRGIVIESTGKNDYNAIDPAMFVDEGGKAYLTWGSYWTGIKGCEIDPAMGKPASTQPEYVSLARRSKQPDPPNIEAPYLVKHGSYYYLMVSWDFCCAGVESTYKVVVGRSTKPLGPFVDRQGRAMTEGGGTVLLASDARWRGPGHNSFLQTRQGDSLVYHVYDAENVRKGRILQVRPVSWTRDGWPRVKDPLLDPQASQRNKKQLSPLVGRWDHLVNGRDHYDIFFEASGKMTGTAGESYWKQEGRQLLLRWIDPRAPGGAWVDHVHLSADGKSYSGKNQNGTTIQGQKQND